MDKTERLLGLLSERQRQCMELVARQHTSKEIARALNLSPSTVDNHIQAAMERLGVRSRADAVRLLSGDIAGRSDASRRWLPPIGGQLNRGSIARRYSQVMLVALLGTMVMAAIVMTIAGIVHLFT
ncbi:response regulator transcription factor [Sphingomonas aestuarii]